MALATVLLVGAVGPAHAAHTTSITRPSGSATGLAGTIRIDFKANGMQSDEVVVSGRVKVFRLPGDVFVEEGQALVVSSSTACYDWVTANALLNAPESANFKIEAYTTVKNAAGQTNESAAATLSSIGVESPDVYRHASAAKLTCSCRRDCVPTSSITSPLSGAQRFSVPIVSWDFKGETFGFGLEYNSHSLIDPQEQEPANFAGLSERNSHFHHAYSQWIDLYQDEAGVRYAVLHANGSYMAFRKTGSNPPTYQSPDANLTLTAGGGAATSPQFPKNDVTGQLMTTTAEQTWFVLKDEDGTEYHFNYQPPAPNSHLAWRVQEATAIPHYLLTRIKDSWGRVLSLDWATGATFEPRVTRVWSSTRNEMGPGILLKYQKGLLTSVTDWQNRTHTLVYEPVPDEDGLPRQRLVRVDVLGTGAPNRVLHTWRFAYRNPANPTHAYGGTYTGDLVIQKTEPDGVVTNYEYEPVALVAPTTGAGFRRTQESDWDGRIAKIWWADPEGIEGRRLIERTLVSAASARLTYPGGVPVLFGYSGDDLTSVTDESTGRLWSYTYDLWNNLTSVRSPVEQTGNPLLEFTPTVDMAGHVTQVITKVLQEDGTLDDPVTATYNALNLPTQITATAKAGGGLNNQVTQFQYDNNGPLTRGNLTKIIEAVASPQGIQQETNFGYAFPDGQWGLPTSVTSPVGATSTFDYQDARGWLIRAASPPNTLMASVAGTTHPDYDPSVTATALNEDGLPILVTDPMLHTIRVSYNAAAPNSPNLVVTLTHPDNSTQQVLLDPFGRVLEAKDENGVLTRWTYTPAGDVKTVTRAVGTADQTVTQFYYDGRGDLFAFDPPKGSGGRVFFDYRRYNQDGSLQGKYEGQVTRIFYPDGTSETFGYFNPSPARDAGELEWYRKADGSLVTLTRDKQHRVKQIVYPANGTIAGFTVTYAYDEFGRVTQAKDELDAVNGTRFTYDDLNRIKTVTPPAAHAPLTFDYFKDTTLQRWHTDVAVGGVGTYKYWEDTKGRLFEVKNPFLANAWRFEYDKDGKNTVLRHPTATSATGVREVRSYNNRDFLERIDVVDAGNALRDRLTYLYGAAGNLLAEADLGGRVHGFEYDFLYRLKAETHPDFTRIDYGYDANGNRRKRTVGGVTDFYGVDAQNKLIWVNQGVDRAPTANQAAPYTLFNYDANGRMTRRERRYTTSGLLRTYDFLWDADDRLRQVKEGAAERFSARYFEDGVRGYKTDLWTGAHYYSWGPGGLLHDTNNGAAIGYTPGLGQTQGSAHRFYHSDWLGSTRYLSDGTGTNLPSALRYDGFGNRSATGGTDPYHSTDFQFGAGWGYQSEYATATEPGLGLQYLEQRYYDPVAGRFISPDPIGFLGGLNLYGYVGSDPANMVDPSGLQARIYTADESPENDAAFTRGVGSARFFQGAGKVGRGLGTGIDVAGSCNPLTNFGLALNDLGKGRFGSAALRLLGPLARVFGRGRAVVVGASGAAKGIADYRIVRYIGRGEKVADVIEELKGRTFQEGLEFGIVTLRDGRRAIVSGGYSGIRLYSGEVKRLIAHVHPPGASRLPSPQDLDALRKLNQKSSHLIAGGTVTKFVNKDYKKR